MLLSLCTARCSVLRSATRHSPQLMWRSCAQNTSPDAHTRTFFSLSVSHFIHAHSAWLKLFCGVKRVRVILSVFTSISFFDVVVERSLSSFPTSPILTCRLAVQTFSVQRPQRPWEEAAEKTPVHPHAGVGCLAEWLTQLQTQVLSPTSSATWTRSTRRSISLTVTEVSSSVTTPP